ncbi:MAG: hypothetical protein U0K87_03000, partial [Ruminococcus sp.]|nr:hypothetical protein [Ruminococcus sp.]
TAALNRHTQLNKLYLNSLIRHEYQAGICGGCFFTSFDAYVIMDKQQNSQKIYMIFVQLF